MHLATWNRMRRTNLHTFHQRCVIMEGALLTTRENAINIKSVFVWLINMLNDSEWMRMLLLQMKVATITWWVSKVLLQTMHSKTTSVMDHKYSFMPNHWQNPRLNCQHETIRSMSKSRNWLETWKAKLLSVWVLVRGTNSSLNLIMNLFRELDP